MKILSIGNSFSQDAQRYLHEIAKADGVDLKTVNLMVGGCSLRTHYLNMLDDAAAYGFEFNGAATGIRVSIRQALVSDDWDYITLQQASPFSPKEETYFPYIEALTDYVKKYCPHAKILIHQTWAYEDGSEKLKKLGYESAEEMFNLIRASYEKAALSIGADGVIPCGEVMRKALQNGLERVHRDGSHLALGVGRYAAALTWYAILTGNSIEENAFNDFDEPVSEEEHEIAVRSVTEAIKNGYCGN